MMVFTVNVAVQASVFVDGGDRLIDTQNADGGWAWILTGTSATNSPGACGSGLLNVYNVTGDVKYLNAAVNAGDFVIAQPGDGYTYRPSVGIFMKQLSDITGDTKYAAAAKTNYYDALEAGTYAYRTTTAVADGLYNTDEYITYINNARDSTPNMALWDFGNIADGAVVLGASQSAMDKWAGAIETGLNNWSGVYATNGHYSVLGLAGGIYGLSAMGKNLTNPISSTDTYLNGCADVEDLADVLVTCQAASGGFTKYIQYVSSSYTGVQETAFAIKALQSVDPVKYASEIAAAQNWLAEVQLDNGGWAGNWAGLLDSEGLGENNQVTGQALGAVPEPATMSLLGLGGLALIRRKRK